MRRIKSPAELGFNHHDRRRLAKACQHARDARFYRRLQTVRLIAEGHPPRAVAQMMGVSLHAVYDLVHRYLQAHRVEDLQERPRSGRPPVATAVTPARIVKEFRRDPLRLGYNTTAWTVPLLATHLSRRYDCLLTARTLRRRMKELGLRWKRPRYVYAQKEPHRAQKKGRLFAA
jgi:transposase